MSGSSSGSASGGRVHSIQDYPGPVKGFACFCWHEHCAPCCWDIGKSMKREPFMCLLCIALIAWAISVFVGIALGEQGKISENAQLWSFLWLPLSAGIILWVGSFLACGYFLVKRVWSDAAGAFVLFSWFTTIAIAATNLGKIPMWAFFFLIFWLIGAIVVGTVIMLIGTFILYIHKDWKKKRGQYTVDVLPDEVENV